ncbi:MAG: prepilin-type N-terminal cleavage/methylation domain-containing protein [Alphaproteobacteria bacterium]|nr:prepilin-type N-terminal cleavage/methylation domain-containing protein [Alphaproteobacteria bacterium]
MSATGNSEAGVTLLEALVVIAIIGLIAGVVGPNIGASLDLLSLRQSASVLQADLRVARATALRTGSRVNVKPLANGRGYDWIGGTKRLPSNISLNMSGPVSFFADGSMVPANVALVSGQRRLAMTFNVTTGAITTGAR